jgi:hypothetical protein
MKELGWLVLGIAVVLFGYWLIISKRPACHSNYVPLFGTFDGWVCVSGYRPDPSN